MTLPFVGAESWLQSAETASDRPSERVNLITARRLFARGKSLDGGFLAPRRTDIDDDVKRQKAAAAAEEAGPEHIPDLPAAG